MRKITVSAIIPSFDSQNTIQACLEALTTQTCRDYEIIVVDSSRDGTSRIIREKFPNVSLYTFTERKYPGEARNFGAAKARGQIFAFTDSDCVVEQDYIETIIEAHKHPSPLIGGIIDNGNPESYVGWGHYFSEFSQWMPQSSPGPIHEVPAGCLSMKRWAYEKYGPFPEGTYSEDSAINWQVRRSGEKPILLRRIKVRHINQTRILNLLRKQALHGRYFAAVRISEDNLSRRRRILFALCSPLLPLVLFCRVCRRIFKTRSYLREFILASPVSFICLISWSLGEFRGYLNPPHGLKLL